MKLGAEEQREGEGLRVNDRPAHGAPASRETSAPDDCAAPWAAPPNGTLGRTHPMLIEGPVRGGVDQFEAAARRLWSMWGEYRGHRICDECQRPRYCHAARRRGRWLCLDCFDLSPEAERLMGRRA